ncbi:MAG: hypothetical protein HY720_28000 [Planctomycetes bacterium]|nr:hypothetical protein [Planctomycetota bacterium]
MPDDTAMSMTTTIRTALQAARIGDAAAASSPEQGPEEGSPTPPEEGTEGAPRPPVPEPDRDPGSEEPPDRPVMPGLEVVEYRQSDEVLGFVKPTDLLRGGSGARFSEPGGEHIFAIVKLRLPASAVFAGKKKLPFSEEPEGYVYEFALSEFHLLDAGGKPLGVPLFDEAGTETGCAGEIGDGGVFRTAATDTKEADIFEEGRLVAVRHTDRAGNELERRFSEKGRGVARVLLKLVQKVDVIEQEFVFRLARGEVPVSVQFCDWAPVPLPGSSKSEPDENSGAGPPPGIPYPVPSVGEWTGANISFEVAEVMDSNGKIVRVVRRVIGTGWPRVQFNSGGSRTSRLEVGGEHPVTDGKFIIRSADSELEGQFLGPTAAEGTWRMTVKPPLQPGDPPEPDRTVSIDWKASLK